eukprot:2019290-Rhodomonas_salina.2
MRCAVLMLEYLKSLCASLVCSTEIATEIAYALSLQSDSRYCDSVCRTAAKQSVVLRSRMCGQGRSGDGGRRRSMGSVLAYGTTVMSCSELLYGARGGRKRCPVVSQCSELGYGTRLSGTELGYGAGGCHWSCSAPLRSPYPPTRLTLHAEVSSVHASPQPPYALPSPTSHATRLLRHVRYPLSLCSDVPPYVSLVARACAVLT